MRRILYRGVFCVLLCLGLSAMAQAPALDTVSLFVQNHSSTCLRRALPEGMAQVLTKLSLNPAVTDVPGVRSALSQAAQFVQRYHYVYQNQPDGTRQLLLQLQFDVPALTQLLRDAGQSVWLGQRPSTLLWLSVSTNAPLSTADDALSSQVHEMADQMGLPLLLPTMDLQDQQFVNAQMAMPFDVPHLQQAAARYHVPSVLAGDMSVAVDGTWQGQWLFLFQGHSFQWQLTDAKTQTQLLQQAVDKMAATMRTQLALHTLSPQMPWVTLQVSGVNNLTDYAVVLSDLKQLSGVQSVFVADMQARTLTLRLHIVGGVKALVAALQGNSDLSALPDNLVTGLTHADLYYQYHTAV